MFALATLCPHIILYGNLRYWHCQHTSIIVVCIANVMLHRCVFVKNVLIYNDLEYLVIFSYNSKTDHSISM